jgi:hypothetical protein
MAATRALRTLGPAVVIAGLLCVGAAPGTARAAQRAPESWSAPTAVPGAVTNGDSAVVAFDGDLYAAWVGKSSPYKIYYSRFNGSTWSASATIPSALTTEYTKPSLAVYEGDLYAEWVGQSSPYHLWFAGFNGSAWTGQTEVPFALTAAFSSPSIAAYGGYLWFSWIGASNKAVWFESVEGGSWSGQAKIPPASGSGFYDDPALVSYDGDLFAFWYQPGPEQIGYATYNLTKWSGAATLVSGTTPAVLSGAAVAVRSGTLYAVWEDQLNQLHYRSFNGSKWSSTVGIPYGVDGPPALADYSGSLYEAADGNPSSSGGLTIDYSVGP